MHQVTCAQALATAQTLGLERLDGQLLLLHALGRTPKERAWLLAHDDDELSDTAAASFRSSCLRRASGEPLAYIVGSKEFFGLNLHVDARVLVPRPDTETLVQWALDVLSAPGAVGAPVLAKPLSVLDMGTGSGAVALAIAHALQGEDRSARVLALDASPDALAVAQANAQQLGLRVDFLQSRWFSQVAGQFDLIASNPPYVASADPHLAALRHEPLQALSAGADGLDDLREIILHAGSYLKAGGWLLLEHGYDQAESVRALLAAAGFHQVQSRQDLAHIERCSGGQWGCAEA